MTEHYSVTEKSDIYLARPWRGITLWANSVADRQLEYRGNASKHFFMINCCISGRCEVCLPSERYIYMEPGVLCVNEGGPRDGFRYPTERYTGIEMVIDMDAAGEGLAPGLTDYGDISGWICQTVQANDGYYIGIVNDEVMTFANVMYRDLIKGEAGEECFRYETLTFLYHLMHGGSSRAMRTSYVTKGQRIIAEDAGKKISADLSARISIGDLAKGYGISASSLKLYFDKVYGMPVSSYLQNLRIEQAKAYLSGTRMKIGEIAERCGYHHQGKFGEAFRRRTGMTPMEYRRRYYKAVESVSELR